MLAEVVVLLSLEEVQELQLMVVAQDEQIALLLGYPEPMVLAVAAVADQE
jgi:hypothetical protein